VKESLIMKIAVFALLALLVGTSGRAQSEPEETPPPAPAAEKTPTATPRRGVAGRTPARVTVVVSRYDREVRTSSQPYVLEAVTEAKATLRIGVEVPINMGATPGHPAPPVQYRTVATHIDVFLFPADRGRFKLDLSLDQSSVAPAREGGEAPTVGAPRFRTFRWASSLVLKDGETRQHVAATDPVTGESVRVDVTLNVVK
jgi:hypothetical protein